MTNFKRLMQTILDLGNKAMKERHWTKIFDKIGLQYTPAFTLSELQNAGIFKEVREGN